MTITSTLFFGMKLWKGAEIYFNPELAGGSGFSGAKGIAGFSNGESFRVGSPAPRAYVARAIFRQIIPVGRGTYDTISEGPNQLAKFLPKKYFYFIGGKFCLSDYFDENKYSHDPRSQFLNWALMDNGAWDYAANVRGYTQGVLIGYESPGWGIRAAAVQEPNTANGADLDGDIANAHSEIIEVEKRYRIGKQRGSLRAFGFINHANMGNYEDAINRFIQYHDTVDITLTRRKNSIKYGFGVSLEQAITEHIGLFARLSYNDGKNETWAYTEIDQSASLGIHINGALWKRADDNFGVAQVVNGISKQHKDYLSAGGYGFIIGDGFLNYAPEFITEVFYNFKFFQYNLFISPDYQLVINPAYNKDRSGPVHIFSLRAHVEF